MHGLELRHPGRHRRHRRPPRFHRPRPRARRPRRRPGSPGPARVRPDLPHRVLPPAVQRPDDSRRHPRRPRLVPPRGPLPHRRTARLRRRRNAGERRGRGIRTAHSRRRARVGCRRAVRPGRLPLRVRRWVERPHHDRRRDLAAARPGAVHPDRHQPRVSLARHLSRSPSRCATPPRSTSARASVPSTATSARRPAGYDVRVVEVRTALVDKTCAEDPHGPGC